MAKKLTKNVWVGGEFYPAGSEPDKDVAEQITNPDAWEADDEADTVGEDGDAAPAKKAAAKKTAKKAAASS